MEDLVWAPRNRLIKMKVVQRKDNDYTESKTPQMGSF
jgi:hypothetical protein